MEVMHLCNNMMCLSPAHLVWGSLKENKQEGFVPPAMPATAGPIVRKPQLMAVVCDLGLNCCLGWQ